MTMLRALWVGGPPGDTLKNIIGKLASDGIEVIAAHPTFRNIPAHVDIVLANVDMLSHPDFDSSKAEAKKLGVKWCAVRTDYSRTRLALVSADVLTATKVQEVPVVAEVKQKTPEELAQDLSRNPENLRKFIAALPKQYRDFVVDAVQQTRRHEVALQCAQACEALGTDVTTWEEFTNMLTAEQRTALRAALA